MICLPSSFCSCFYSVCPRAVFVNHSIERAVHKDNLSSTEREFMPCALSFVRKEIIFALPFRFNCTTFLRPFSILPMSQSYSISIHWSVWVSLCACVVTKLCAIWHSKDKCIANRHWKIMHGIHGTDVETSLCVRTECVRYFFLFLPFVVSFSMGFRENYFLIYSTTLSAVFNLLLFVRFCSRTRTHFVNLIQLFLFQERILTQNSFSGHFLHAQKLFTTAFYLAAAFQLCARALSLSHSCIPINSRYATFSAVASAGATSFRLFHTVASYCFSSPLFHLSLFYCCFLFCSVLALIVISMIFVLVLYSLRFLFPVALHR